MDDFDKSDKVFDAFPGFFAVFGMKFVLFCMFFGVVRQNIRVVRHFLQEFWGSSSKIAGSSLLFFCSFVGFLYNSKKRGTRNPLKYKELLVPVPGSRSLKTYMIFTIYLLFFFIFFSKKGEPTRTTNN